jgi:hypothetical protein
LTLVLAAVIDAALWLAGRVSQPWSRLAHETRLISP